LRARVPNFVKSSKTKDKDSPAKRISVAQLQHPASLTSLHQMHSQQHQQHQQMMAAHHQHHQQLMWHARSYESGIGINDRTLSHPSHLHCSLDTPLVGSRHEIYSRIRHDDKQLLPRLVTSPSFNSTNPVKIITAFNPNHFCCMAQAAQFQKKRSKSDINIQLSRKPSSHNVVPSRKHSAHVGNPLLYRICEFPHCDQFHRDGMGVKSRSIESFVSHNKHHHNKSAKSGAIDDDYCSHRGRDVDDRNEHLEKEKREKYSPFVEKPRVSTNPIYGTHKH
jgi:hypothetical protein